VAAHITRPNAKAARRKPVIILLSPPDNVTADRVGNASPSPVYRNANWSYKMLYIVLKAD
jgi:hypothetical protein